MSLNRALDMPCLIFLCVPFFKKTILIRDSGGSDLLVGTFCQSKLFYQLSIFLDFVLTYF